MKILKINQRYYNADKLHSFWWDQKELSFYIKIGEVTYCFKNPSIGISYSEVRKLEDFLLDERTSPCYNSYSITFPEVEVE